MNLPVLNFPSFSFQVRQYQGSFQIFDRIRKKWVALTPEEWVRQHLIWYLIEHKDCPESLIQVEYGFQTQNKSLRVDVAVFSNSLEPLLLCECKAPSAKLSTKSLSQLALYNITYQSAVILLTNGIDHYCMFFDHEWKFLNEIPDYRKLKELSGRLY